MLNVAVIIPNYNHAHYLPEALDRILAQSPKEVIVVDDASTDNSMSVLEGYKKKHAQLTILQSEKNLGPVKAVNRGISQASSEYIAFCAADDLILPGFLEETSAFLDAHPELGLCCGQICHFSSENPEVFTSSPMLMGNRSLALSPDALVKTFARTIFFINTNATLYRRKHLLEFGGYDQKLLHISDWYLSYQVALHHGAGYIPKTFGAFRLSPDSYSAHLKHSFEKNAVYHYLIQQIQSEGKAWNRIFRKTGLLAHVGVSMILFLFFHPRYWSYLPTAFLKKCQFHWHKVTKTKKAYQL